MSPRFLLFAALVAMLCSSADTASARHRRFFRQAPPPTLPAPPPTIVEVQPAPLNAEERDRAVERQLKTRVSVTFTEVPLSQAIDVLIHLSKINIVPNTKSLKNDGIDYDCPVTLSLEDVPLKAVLTLLLSPANATYVIRDGKIEITSRQELKQVTYPVADLVVPFPTRENLDVVPLPARRLAKDMIRRQTGEVDTNATTEDKLVDLITSCVAPRTWNAVGGKGSIQYFPLGMSLVVNQTAAVQEDVRALLSALRKVQAVEVMLEVRIVVTSPAAFERACGTGKVDMKDAKEMTGKVDMKDAKEMLSWRFVVPNGIHYGKVDMKDAKEMLVQLEKKFAVASRGPRGSACLDESQVLKLISNMQDDPCTNVMQAPKLTMAHGQKAALEMTEDHFFLDAVEVHSDGDKCFFAPRNTPFTTGLRLAICPTVSADRESVRVRMNGYWAKLTGPMDYQPIEVPRVVTTAEGAQETGKIKIYLAKPKFARVRLQQDLAIPDGKTMLFNCGVVSVETRNALLSAITVPVFGQEVTQSAERQILFLITPRIHINAEEEQSNRDEVRTIPR